MMMRYSCVMCLVAIATVSLAPDRAFSQTPSPPLLQLETKIPLGDVKGRIDHMAIDLPRRRLFVAELGNDTVGVVDLNEQKVQHVITELKEPQGVGYVPSSDTVFVTNAGDGSVLLSSTVLRANRQGAGRSTTAAIFQWLWTKVPAEFLWRLAIPRS